MKSINLFALEVCHFQAGFFLGAKKIFTQQVDGKNDKSKKALNMHVFSYLNT